MESCLSFYVNIAGGGGVGRQPLSRKSRVREFMLALRPFNLRMQALRRPRTSLLPFVITGIPNTSFRASYRHNLDTRYSSRPGSQMCRIRPRTDPWLGGPVPMPLVPEIPIAISCLR
jgi:hypothetical protein